MRYQGVNGSVPRRRDLPKACNNSISIRSRNFVLLTATSLTRNGAKYIDESGWKPYLPLAAAEFADDVAYEAFGVTEEH